MENKTYFLAIEVPHQRVASKIDLNWVKNNPPIEADRDRNWEGDHDLNTSLLFESEEEARDYKESLKEYHGHQWIAICEIIEAELGE